jgi:hypothetical protein
MNMTNVSVSVINSKLKQYTPLRMDPQTVDELLTEEMGKLSFQARNAIFEELHGVGSCAPEETHELIERSLIEMSNEIDRIKHKYTAYVEATTIKTLIPSSSSEETGTIGTIGTTETGTTGTYNPYVREILISDYGFYDVNCLMYRRQQSGC